MRLNRCGHDLRVAGVHEDRLTEELLGHLLEVEFQIRVEVRELLPDDSSKNRRGARTMIVVRRWRG